MLTGVAALRHSSIVFPGDWVFVLGVLLFIVLIFFRVYARGGRSGPRNRT